MGNKYDTTAIRNLAFVGHGGSGKTFLCEALLKEAGLATRLPAGIMDYAQDEKDTGHSIELAIARFSWQDKEITMIDVPGYADFCYNVASALAVVETAVVVISASDGITVNTRKVWDAINQKGLPKAIVITKLDEENINFDNLIANIQKQFGKICVPLTVPDELGASCSKVHNIFSKDLPEAYNIYRDQLVETIVETDDALLNRYLEGEKFPQEILEKQLAKAIAQKKAVPILSIISPKDIGIKEFLQVTVQFLPCPLDVPRKSAKIKGQEAETAYDATPEAPFSGQIFKVFNDPFGRLIYFRVYSGTLTSPAYVYDVNADKSERVTSIFHVVGKEQKNAEKAIPGDIVLITKVESFQLGDTLVTNEKSPILYDKILYPVPMVSLAVQPKARVDEQRISSSLAKVAEEDPTFQIRREESTNEMVVVGMTNLHLDTMLNRLKNRFKVECTHSIPKIPYRETISGKSEARFRHKKQSGGHGQFAEVALRLEPTARGSGFEFVDQIVGGVVPSQFVASTEKGIRGAMQRGILAGCPVVDVQVALWDGKTHEVDSSDAAFQIAASKAFQEGFMQAKPVLLEPVQILEVTIPTKYLGDISGHLNSKRGRILGTEVNGDYQTIKAQVPLSEVLTYSSDLKSMTGGEGSYTMQFSHYDAVPSYLQDKIIAKAKEAMNKEKEEK